MTALHRAQARTMVNGASCPGRPESPSLTEPTENSALPLPCLSSCPYPHTAQGVFHPRTPELSPWPQPLVVAAVTLPHEALLWEEMCGARLSSQGPASRDAKSKVPAHGGHGPGSQACWCNATLPSNCPRNSWRVFSVHRSNTESSGDKMGLPLPLPPPSSCLLCKDCSSRSANEENYLRTTQPSSQNHCERPGLSSPYLKQGP